MYTKRERVLRRKRPVHKERERASVKERES